jgi:hypothetical protein
MRTAIALAAAVLASCATSAAAQAGPAAPGAAAPLPLEEATRVARAALPTFRELVAAQKNAREMGFESADELARAELGDPLPVFLVPLDQLRRYERGTDPGALLAPAPRVLYPVTVERQVRSSLAVIRTEKGLQASSFGSPNRTRLIDRARGASMERTRLPAAAYFEVDVPALNLVFVGHREEQRLMLTPVISDRLAGLEAGATQPAEQVFSALVPAARAQADAPR